MGRPGGEVAHAMVVGEEAAAAAAVAARNSIARLLLRRLGHHVQLKALQEGLPAERSVCRDLPDLRRRLASALTFLLQKRHTMLTRLCARIGRAGTRASPLFTSASASASLPRLGLGLSGAASVAAIALYHSEGSAAADAAPPTPPGASRSMMQPPDDADWNRMIMSRLPAVVSIKVNRPRAFDTSSSGTVQATGFVVDKERGLIMTNRHVAGPGPVVAEAIFSNNEEVTLTVAYTDPVHFALFGNDFGSTPVKIDVPPE